MTVELSDNMKATAILAKHTVDTKLNAHQNYLVIIFEENLLISKYAPEYLSTPVDMCLNIFFYICMKSKQKYAFKQLKMEKLY